MKKIRPSEAKNNRNIDILSGKDFTGATDILLLLAESILQRSLESEATEKIGREWYKREEKSKSSDSAQSQRPIYRNGYYSRHIKTIEGILELLVPRLRNTEEPYESKILNNLTQMLSGQLREMVREVIVRGLSYRDVEKCFQTSEGEPILSRSSMSEIMEETNKELERFRNMDLTELDVIYLFLDGVYESVKSYTQNQTILCCWGITSEGEKRLLGLSTASSESESTWGDFIEDMKTRGLRQPLLVVSDGNKGMIKAITRHFPKSRRQRCIAHKMRNLMGKLQEEVQKKLKNEIHQIYYSNDRTEADTRAADFIRKYSDKYPEMVRCFIEDLPACLEQLNFPESHRKFIRTTNLIERVFVEEKRRTKIIPTHQNEKSMMNLVFSVLIRASYDWRKMKISALDKSLLLKIRNIMGSDSDNSNFLSLKGAA
jgi:putative transposase